MTSAMDQPVRILVVDDHPVVREGLKVLINGEPELMVCCETGSFREAQLLAREHQPDVVIVDLYLDDGNGLDLIRRLKHQYPAMQFLVCSVGEESLFAERAIKTGAKGFINKKEISEHIVQAIRQVLDGKIYVSSTMVQSLLSGSTERASSDGVAIEDLTPRELDVFLLIGKGASTAQIANQLSVSVKTVETHREKIKRKLGLTSGNELVRCALLWNLEQH
ncbi:MAG: response regulator [Gammaproteobacteria bacterium]|nr:response regulator [Gammaproteobacteria bacterium]